MEGANQSLIFEIQFRVEEAQRRLKGMQAGLESFRATALAAGGAAAAIAGSLALAVNAYKDFEAVLNSIASVAGATEEELQALKAAALDLGAKTQYSAKQAAQGMLELSRAGFTVNQTLEAMPGVLALAAAGQVQVGAAAEVTAGILRGFNLEMDKAGLVADMLAKAANQSAIDVGDIALSMKYIGPIASATSQSLGEMTGILAVLGNSMIKGDTAGTTLRSAIVSLQKPTDDSAALLHKMGVSIEDTQGKMLPLSDIVAQLRTGLEGQTEVQKSATLATIFGAEALSGMMALINQAPGAIEEYIKAQNNATGAAQEMADKMNQGIAFAIDQMNAAIETLANQVGEDLAPALIATVGALKEAIGTFAGMPAPVRQAVVTMAVATAGILAASAAIGGLLAVLPILGAGFAALTGPVGIAVAAIVGLGTVLGALWLNFKKTEEASQATAGALQGQLKTVGDLTRRYEELEAKTKRTKAEEAERKTILERLEQLSPKLISGYNAQGEALGINKTAVEQYNVELREKIRLEEENLRVTMLAAREKAAAARIDGIQALHELQSLQARRDEAVKKAEERLARAEANLARTATNGNKNAVEDAKRFLAGTITRWDTEITAKKAEMDGIRSAIAESQKEYDALKKAQAGGGGSTPPPTPTRGKTVGDPTAKGTEDKSLEKLVGLDLIRAKHSAQLSTDEELRTALLAEQAKLRNKGLTDTAAFLDITRDINTVEAAIQSTKERAKAETEQEHQKRIRGLNEALQMELARVKLNGKGMAGEKEALEAHLTAMRKAGATESEILAVRVRIQDVNERIAASQKKSDEDEAKRNEKSLEESKEALSKTANAVGALGVVARDAAAALGVDLGGGLGQAVAAIGGFLQGGLQAVNALVAITQNALKAIPALLEMGAAAWASLGPYAALAAAVMAAAAAIAFFIGANQREAAELKKIREEGVEARIKAFETEVQLGNKSAQEQIAFYRAIADGAEASSEQRAAAARRVFDLELDLHKQRLRAHEDLKATMGEVAQAELDWAERKRDYLRTLASEEKRYTEQQKTALQEIADLEAELRNLERDEQAQIQDVLNEGLAMRRKSEAEQKQDRIKEIQAKAEERRKELEEQKAAAIAERDEAVKNLEVIAAAKARLSDEEREQLQAIADDKRTAIELEALELAKAQEVHQIRMGALTERATALAKILGLEQGVVNAMLAQASAAGKAAQTSAGAGQAGAGVVGAAPTQAPQNVDWNAGAVIKEAEGARDWANRSFLGIAMTGNSDQRQVLARIQELGKSAVAMGDEATAEALRGIIGSFRFLTKEQTVPQFKAGGILPDRPEYDGMPARLHRGEMVLPRDITQGLVASIRGSNQPVVAAVTISGNYIHPATDLNKLARDIAPAVNREIGAIHRRKGLM